MPKGPKAAPPAVAASDAPREFSKAYFGTPAFATRVLDELRAGNAVEWVELERDHASLYTGFCGVVAAPDGGYLAWNVLDDFLPAAPDGAEPVANPAVGSVRRLTEQQLLRKLRAQPGSFRNAAWELVAEALRAALAANDLARLRSLAEELEPVRYSDRARALWATWPDGLPTASYEDAPGQLERLGELAPVRVGLMARWLWPEAEALEAARWTERTLRDQRERTPKHRELARWHEGLRAFLGEASGAGVAAQGSLEQGVFARLFAGAPTVRRTPDRSMERHVRAYLRARLRAALERGDGEDVRARAHRFEHDGAGDAVLALWASVADLLEGREREAARRRLRAQGAKRYGELAVELALRLESDAGAAARRGALVCEQLERLLPRAAQTAPWRAALEERAAGVAREPSAWSAERAFVEQLAQRLEAEGRVTLALEPVSENAAG